MEAPLKDCTTLEQRAVIRFLSSEGIQTSKICQRMKNIYGESCLSQKNIYKWVNEFKNGRITCSSDPGTFFHINLFNGSPFDSKYYKAQFGL
ncbi:hypothetical protein LAZ67_5002135 [Cordylochernes scorpioides]|uniref:Mos1 transposase HTH domain-containing protein n=1 Tax=Cordylochernes scorpioides TaxID=51811 RepID=A0ABY6KGE9_9ARAC|nr:hypothetical protein LAZ67_5002135 [Cordylochernes scorpioides]